LKCALDDDVDAVAHGRVRSIRERGGALYCGEICNLAVGAAQLLDICRFVSQPPREQEFTEWISELRFLEELRGGADLKARAVSATEKIR
jgi:hypothetical protein